MAEGTSVPAWFTEDTEGLFSTETVEEEEEPVVTPDVVADLDPSYSFLHQDIPFENEETSSLPSNRILSPSSILPREPSSQVREFYAPKPELTSRQQEYEQTALLREQRQRAFEEGMAPKGFAEKAFGYAKPLFQLLNAPQATLLAVFNTLADEDSDGLFKEWWDAVVELKSIGGQLFGLHETGDDPLFGLLDTDKTFWGNPIVQFAGALVLDVLTDPLTYVGGIGAVSKITANFSEEALERIGREVAEGAAKGGAREAVESAGGEALKRILPAIDEPMGTGATRLRKLVMERMPSGEVKFGLNTKGEKILRDMLTQGHTVQQANQTVARMIKDGRIDLLYGGGLRFRVPFFGNKQTATWARSDLYFQPEYGKIGNVQQSIAAAEKHFLSGGHAGQNAWHFTMQGKDWAWKGLSKHMGKSVNWFHNRKWDKTLERFAERPVAGTIEKLGDKLHPAIRDIGRINLSSLSIFRRTSSETWDAARRLRDEVTYEAGGSTVVWNRKTQNTLKRLAKQVVDDGLNITGEGIELTADEVEKSIISQIFELAHIDVGQNKIADLSNNIHIARANLGSIAEEQRRLLLGAKADPDTGLTAYDARLNELQTRAEDADIARKKAEKAYSGTEELLDEAHLAEVISASTKREVDDLTRQWKNLQIKEQGQNSQLRTLIEDLEAQYDGPARAPVRADDSIGQDWMIAEILRSNADLQLPLFAEELKRFDLDGGSDLFSQTGDLLSAIRQRVIAVQEQLQDSHLPLASMFMDGVNVPKAFNPKHLHRINKWFGEPAKAVGLLSPSDVKVGVQGFELMPKLGPAQLALSLLKTESIKGIHTSLKDGTFNELVGNGLERVVGGMRLGDYLPKVPDVLRIDRARQMSDAGFAKAYDELVTLATYGDESRVKTWVENNTDLATYLDTRYGNMTDGVPTQEGYVEIRDWIRGNRSVIKEHAPRLNALLEGYDNIENFFTPTGRYNHLDNSDLMDTDIINTLRMHEERTARYLGNKTYINELTKRFGKPASELEDNGEVITERVVNNAFIGVAGGGLGVQQEIEDARKEGREVNYADPKIALNMLMAGILGGKTDNIIVPRHLKWKNISEIFTKHRKLAHGGASRAMKWLALNSEEQIVKRYPEGKPESLPVVNFNHSYLKGLHPDELVNQDLESKATVTRQVYDEVFGFNKHSNSDFKRVESELRKNLSKEDQGSLSNNPVVRWMKTRVLSPDQHEVSFNNTRWIAEGQVSSTLEGAEKYIAIEEIANDLDNTATKLLKEGDYQPPAISEVYGDTYADYIESVRGTELESTYRSLGKIAFDSMNRNIRRVDAVGELEQVVHNNKLLKYMWDNSTPNDIRFSSSGRELERNIFAVHYMQLINNNPELIHKSFYGTNMGFMKNLVKMTGGVWDEQMMYDQIVDIYYEAIKSNPTAYSKFRKMMTQAGRIDPEKPFERDINAFMVLEAGADDSILGSDTIVKGGEVVSVEDIESFGAKEIGEVLDDATDDVPFDEAKFLPEKIGEQGTFIGDDIAGELTEEELLLAAKETAERSQRIEGAQAEAGERIGLTQKMRAVTPEGGPIVTTAKLNGKPLSMQHLFGDVAKRGQTTLTRGPVVVNEAVKTVNELYDITTKIADILDNDVVRGYITDAGMEGQRGSLGKLALNMIENAKLNKLHTGYIEGNDILDLYRDDPDGIPIELLKVFRRMEEAGQGEAVKQLQKANPAKAALPYVMSYGFFTESLLANLFDKTSINAEDISSYWARHKDNPAIQEAVEAIRGRGIAAEEVQRSIEVLDDPQELVNSIIDEVHKLDVLTTEAVRVSRNLDAQLDELAELGVPAKKHIESIANLEVQGDVWNGWSEKVKGIWGKDILDTTDQEMREIIQVSYKKADDERALTEIVLGLDEPSPRDTTINELVSRQQREVFFQASKGLDNPLEGGVERTLVRPLRMILETADNPSVFASDLAVVDSITAQFKEIFPDKHIDDLDLAELLRYFSEGEMKPSNHRVILYEHVMRNPLDIAARGTFTHHVHRAIRNLKGSAGDSISTDMNSLIHKDLVTYKDITESLSAGESELLLNAIDTEITKGTMDGSIGISKGYTAQEFDTFVNWLDRVVSNDESKNILPEGVQGPPPPSLPGKITPRLIANMYQAIAGRGSPILIRQGTEATTGRLISRMSNAYGAVERIAGNQKVNMHPFDLIDMIFSLHRSGDEVTGDALRNMFNDSATSHLNQQVKDAVNIIADEFNTNKALESLPELWAYKNIMGINDSNYHPRRMRNQLEAIFNSYQNEKGLIEAAYKREQVVEAGIVMPQTLGEGLAEAGERWGNIEHFLNPQTHKDITGKVALAQPVIPFQLLTQTNAIVVSGDNQAALSFGLLHGKHLTGTISKQGGTTNEILTNVDMLQLAQERSRPTIINTGGTDFQQPSRVSIRGMEVTPDQEYIWVPASQRDNTPLDLSLALTDEAIDWFSHEPVARDFSRGKDLLVQTINYLNKQTRLNGLSPFISIIDLQNILKGVGEFRVGKETNVFRRDVHIEGLYKELTGKNIFRTPQKVHTQGLQGFRMQDNLLSPVRDTFTRDDITNAIRLLHTIGLDNTSDVMLDGTKIPLPWMTHDDMSKTIQYWLEDNPNTPVSPLVRSSGVHRSRNGFPGLVHADTVAPHLEMASEAKWMTEQNVAQSDGVIVIKHSEDYHSAIQEARNQNKPILIINVEDMGINFERGLGVDEFNNTVPVKEDYRFDSAMFEGSLPNIRKWLFDHKVTMPYYTGLSEYNDPGITDLMGTIMHRVYIGSDQLPRLDAPLSRSANGFEVSGYRDPTKVFHYDPSNPDKVVGNPSASIDRIRLHVDDTLEAIPYEGNINKFNPISGEQVAEGQPKREMVLNEYFNMVTKGWGEVFNYKHLREAAGMSETYDAARVTKMGSDDSLEWIADDSTYSGIYTLIKHLEDSILTGRDFRDGLKLEGTGLDEKLFEQIVVANPEIFIERKFPTPMQKALDETGIDLAQEYKWVEWDRELGPAKPLSGFRQHILSSGQDVSGNDMFTSIPARNQFLELQGWMQSKFKEILDHAYEQKPSWSKDAITGEVIWQSGYMPIGVVPDATTGKLPSGSMKSFIHQLYKDTAGRDITDEFRASAVNRLNRGCGSADAVCYWMNNKFNSQLSSGTTTNELLGTHRPHDFYSDTVPQVERSWTDKGEPGTKSGLEHTLHVRPLDSLLRNFIKNDGDLLQQINKTFDTFKENMFTSKGRTGRKVVKVKTPKDREQAYWPDVLAALRLLDNLSYGEGSEAIQRRILEFLAVDIGGEHTLEETIKVMNRRVDDPAPIYEGGRLLSKGAREGQSKMVTRYRVSDGSIADIKPRLAKIARDMGIGKVTDETLNEFKIAVPNFRDMSPEMQQTTLDNLQRRLRIQAEEADVERITHIQEPMPFMAEDIDIRPEDLPAFDPDKDLTRKIRELLQGDSAGQERGDDFYRTKAEMDTNVLTRRQQLSAKLKVREEELKKVLEFQKEQLEAGAESTLISEVLESLQSQNFTGPARKVNPRITNKEREVLKRLDNPEVQQLVNETTELIEVIDTLDDAAIEDGVRIYDDPLTPTYERSREVIGAWPHHVDDPSLAMIQKMNLSLERKEVTGLDIAYNPDLMRWFKQHLTESFGAADEKIDSLTGKATVVTDIDLYLKQVYQDGTLREYLYYIPDSYPTTGTIDDVTKEINGRLKAPVDNAQRDVDDILQANGFQQTEERVNTKHIVAATGITARKNKLRAIAQWDQDTLPEGVYSEKIYEAAAEAGANGIGAKFFSSSQDETNQIARLIELGRIDKKYEYSSSVFRKQDEGKNLLNDMLGGLARVSIASNPEFLEALARSAHPGEATAEIRKLRVAYKKSLEAQLTNPQTGNAHALDLSNNMVTRTVLSRTRTKSGEKFPVAHVVLNDMLSSKGKGFIKDTHIYGSQILSGEAPITEDIFSDIATSYKRKGTGERAADVATGIHSIVDIIDPKKLVELDEKQGRIRGSNIVPRMSTHELMEATADLGGGAIELGEAQRRLQELFAGREVSNMSTLSNNQQDTLRQLQENPVRRYYAGGTQLLMDSLLEDGWRDVMTPTLIPLGNKKRMLELVNNGDDQALKDILSKDASSVRALVDISTRPVVLDTAPESYIGAVKNTVERLMTEEYTPVTRGYLEFLMDNAAEPRFKNTLDIAFAKAWDIFENDPNRMGNVIKRKFADKITKRYKDKLTKSEYRNTQVFAQQFMEYARDFDGGQSVTGEAANDMMDQIMEHLGPYGEFEDWFPNLK